MKGKRQLNAAQRKQIDKVYRSQLESLIAVDRLVQAIIVRELRRRDALDDTVVVFTSDNGFNRGQHRIESGRASLYDEAIPVPLLARGPGFPQSHRDERVVGNVDLAPTIIDLAGAKPSLAPSGLSLLPFDDRRADRRPNLLLEVLERDSGNFVGVRTRRYAYAEYAKKNKHGDNKRELYDLYGDPRQLESVVDEPAYADEVERLHQRVTELRDCGGADCR